MCYFAIQDLASFAATSLGKRGKMENEDVNVFYPTSSSLPCHSVPNAQSY